MVQDFKVGDHVWIWDPWSGEPENPPVEAIVDQVSDQGYYVHMARNPRVVQVNYKGPLYSSREEAGKHFSHWVNRFLEHIEIELSFCQEGPSFQVGDQVWVWDRWSDGIYEGPWKGVVKEVLSFDDYMIHRMDVQGNFYRSYLSIFSTKEEATNVYLFMMRQHKSELEKRRQEWQEVLNQWGTENAEDSRLGGTT